MSQLVYGFVVTVPAGTEKAGNWTQDVSFASAVVNTIEVRVPPGPRGNMGFAIGSGGTAVMPFNAGEWIVTDDEKITWGVDDQFDSGAWQVLAYNLGRYDHALYIRFLCDPTAGRAGQTSPLPLSASVLES